MSTFSLISRPWIPVLGPEGHQVVGLGEVLGGAGELDLAVPDPVQRSALLRQVLLPIVIDALGYPTDEDEWGERWTARSFASDELASYLEQHADRFDLFDPVKPFAQVGGLEALSGGTKPASLLIGSAATGNNVPLFSPWHEADAPVLAPSAAAFALLATQCWDTAAIKTGARGDPKASAGKTTGNPTGPAGQLGLVVPVGRTLFETIMFSLPISAAGGSAEDRPWWRRDPPTASWTTRPATGLLDLLTWQSRRILLIPEDPGDGCPVVRRVVVSAGDRLARAPKDIEPHTVWQAVDKPKAGDPSYRAVRHQSGRALWRGLPGLLAIATADGLKDPSKWEAPWPLTQIGDLSQSGVLPADLHLGIASVGIEYGNQSAVVENVIADQIPVPVVALARDQAVRELLVRTVAEADAARVALNFMADDLRRAVGGEPVPWDKSQRPGDQLLHSFDPLVRRLLVGVQREPHRAAEGYRAWQSAARRVSLEAAEPLLLAVPPDAFLGRISERPEWCAAVAERKFRNKIDQIFATEYDATEPDATDHDKEA